jgi:hypothetical protein
MKQYNAHFNNSINEKIISEILNDKYYQSVV